jgi:hypothetical protein
MPGCGKEIEVVVPTKYATKMVKTTCGSTGYYGYPNFCEPCAEKYAHRDWRREAEEAGEQWEEDY